MENKERRYELDWLRVLAFALLIFYHTGMFFVSWEWHLKNNQVTQSLEWPMLFLSQWRMSLIFLISGAGIFYAIRQQSTLSFTKDRLKRILLPLLFGILVIVPPQIYLERLSQGASFSYTEFWPSTFQLKVYPEGNFSWHHLWYLAYVLVYTLMFLPFFMSVQRQSIISINKWILLFAPAIWLSLGEAALRPLFPVTHALVNDWANHFLYISIFLSGFLIFSSSALQKKIQEVRWISFAIAFLLLSVLYLNYWIPDQELHGAELRLFYALKSCNRWFWIMTILGFALQHLNVKWRYLKEANQMVYPFYILHQTVIIVLGFYLKDLLWPIALKFGLISIGTFIICFLLTRYIIMYIPLLRLLFGLPILTAKPNRAEEIATPLSIKQRTAL